METIKVKVVVGVNEGDTCFSACESAEKATFSDLRNRVWEKLGTASKLYEAVLEVPRPMPSPCNYVTTFCLRQ